MPCSCSLGRSALAALAALLLAGAPAPAATFIVDSTADALDVAPGDHECRTAGNLCSLRAAVQEANALTGLDEIRLPAGTFSLGLAGANEDAGLTGDLDVTDDVTLVGAGEDQTILDAAALDRYFDHHPGPLGTTLWLIGLTVRNGATSGNGGDGGCFRNPENGVLLFDSVTVRDCRGLRFGGAVFNGGRFETFESSLIGNGDPSLDSGLGGALANVGANARAFLLRSELHSNGAQNGGAIYTSADFVNPNTSELRIEHCSIFGNSARQNGGAILNNSLTKVYLEDSTVSTNLGGHGGGLFNDGGGVFNIRNSTIRRNHANGIGGGISEVHFNADFIRLRNSILAGNTAVSSGPDCNLRIRSEGGTLLGSSSSCQMTSAGGDLVDVDPLLGPLRRMGRRSWAHLPQPGSPAIDAGANALCSPDDQLGTPRPLDGNNDGQAFCDIGAIESAGELFLAGFETGDTSEWSTTVP
jgi:CSLREA domain-containing protein